MLKTGIIKQKTMETKQTAVEWLMMQLPVFVRVDLYEKELYQQAKAMEKEQISNGYYQGLIDGMNNSPREYYEETYGTRQSNN